MTQEEKAKAYDEAVKKVKDFYEGKTKLYSDVEQTLDLLFPELKESEDEKIRKALLEYFGEECDTATINGIYCYKIYDWLKKKKSVKWSERDDAYFAICKNALYEYHKLDKGGVEITIEWLESLKKRTGE